MPRCEPSGRPATSCSARRILAILAEALLRRHDPSVRGQGHRHARAGDDPAQPGGAARPPPGPPPERYPVWTDNLWLSIFALDLLGNHFDLYDRYRYFDAIPHAHGTGAATVVVAELLDLSPLSAVGVAQLGHIGLEAQEYYSDVWFGLHNVRGTWDTVNDLLAGAAGSVVYAALLAVSRARRGSGADG